MNSVNHTPITFKAQEPAIFDYDAMKKIAERNPQTYSIEEYESVCPWGLCHKITRNIDGNERILEYSPNGQLMRKQHNYITERNVKYDFDKNEYSVDIYKDYIRTDGEGSYIKNFNNPQKFANFREMLVYLRKQKAEQEKHSSAILRFINNLLLSSSWTVTVDGANKKVKEEFLQTVQKRINANLSSCITASLVGLSGLIWGLVSGTPAGMFLSAASGPFTGLFMGLSRIHLKDKIKFMKSPLYKEYKALLPEKTGMMQRAIKALQKPMKMIKT